MLTALSLTVAFVLFMLLRALGAAFTGGVSVPDVQRLLVDAKYAMTDNLPLAAVQTVREIPGVAEATQMSWFGGYYQDPAHAFAKTPVDHTRYFRIFRSSLGRRRRSAGGRRRHRSPLRELVRPDTFAVRR